jgi:ABC-type transport system substrate-binding protein
VGKFDPAKAATILDEAGYTLVDGKRVDKTGKPISLEVMTFDPLSMGQR